MDRQTLSHLQTVVWPRMEDQAGLPRGILNAIARWETRGTYDTKAYNRSSGARGVFQLTPIALRQVQIDTGFVADPHNPYQASTAALALLTRLHRMFSGQLSLILAAYNAGEGTVRRLLRDIASSGKGRLPLETREYIINVSSML